ncbi:MAG: hypothetical protein QXU82_00400 [Candidatus Aenigmatarchaeota archaeon]
MNLKLLKEWRVLLLLALVMFSIASIMPSSQEGVIVKSVSSDSPFIGKVAAGDRISWANEKTINAPQDLYVFDNYTGVFRFMKNGELMLISIDKPGLKIIVDDPSASRLKFGMDLVGGTRVLLKPLGNVSDAVVQQIMATLETRINVYGLREAKFQAVSDVEGNKYVQIEMAGGSKAEVEDLLSKQGVFEGKVGRSVEFKNGTGSFWGKTVMFIDNETMRVDGADVSVNGTFRADGIDFKLVNITQERAVFLAEVFKGADIKSVCMQEQAGICTSRLIEQKNGWQFMFQVFVSQEGAERFAKVTKDMKVIVDPNSGDSYLDGKMVLLLDNKLITDLNIASELAGKAYTEPVITGFRQQKEDAQAEKLMLQSILQSGALPTQLEINRIDQISPSLGQEFLGSALIAGLSAVLAVGVIVTARYRNWKISLPMTMTMISEAVIILGVASWINWTIDLASIAGIIATVGTGVDAQIMIVDELRMGEKKVYTLKQKMKKAMFVIFSSASTTVAAMVPLLFVGIGVMRGFAVTTTLGVFIGIGIARPAFSKIVEFVFEKEELTSSA